MESRPFLLAILLFIGAFVFLFHLGGRDLWEPDETRYAVIAREMRESGNWILPRLNGQIYAEKPALFFWLVNLSTTLLGDNEFANRLPSALAGWVTVLVTFLFGERIFNAKVGFLSGLVLATSFFFPQISRWMMLDSLFTLFFLLTLFFFYQGYKKDKGRRVHYLLAGSCIGLGVLTKGPIAYLSVPVFLILGFFEKDVKRFWNRDLLWGFLLSLAVVLIWGIPACWAGGEDYTKRILFGQTIGRLAGNGKHFHPQSFLFYFIRFPVEFLPWTLFLPAAVVLELRKKKEERKTFLLLGIWFLVVFLFFSFSKGKKDNYILPLYPAVAILVGRWLASFLQSREATRNGRVALLNPVGWVALLFFLLWLAVQLSPFKWLPRGIGPYLSFAVWPLTIATFGGILSWVFFLRRSNRLSIFSLMGTLIVAQTYLSISIPLRFNELMSKKPFSRQVHMRVGPGDELKIWKFQSTGLLYYTGRSIEQIKNKGRLIAVLSGPRRVFLVVEEEDFSTLKKLIGDELLRPVERAKGGHQRLLLFSNEAVPQS